MSKLTIYLARLFGVFTLLVVAAMYLKGGTAIAAAASDKQAMLIYGILSVGIGVAMVLGHNVWSRGLLALVVTLLGWIILAKGLLLLFATPDALTNALSEMHYAEHAPLYLLPAFVIGLYLTVAGFLSRGKSS
jgi:hypothetical protein